MRLVSLHLLAYGAFTDQRLSFGPDAGRLHLVYGPNESGKSTTLRAISDLLFGFPQRTTDAFLHDETALRIGAEVLSDAGQSLAFVRRKGRTKTLLDPKGTALSDSVLDPFVGNLERSFFERMFGLNHERLRQGSEDLLREGGDAGVGLFQAGAGINNLTGVLQLLDEEAGNLFRPRGQKQLINASLKTLTDIRKNVRTVSLSDDAWVLLQNQRAATDKSLEEVCSKLDALRKEQGRLERIKRNLPAFARRASLQAELEGLQSVPELSPSATKDRLDGEQAHRSAKDRLQSAQEQCSRWSQELEQLVLPEPLLAQSETIESLAHRRSVVREAENDLRRREAEERQHRGRLEGLLREARLSVMVQEAESHLPSRPEATKIRELAKRHERVMGEYTSLVDTIDRVNLELETRKTQLAERVDGPDAGELEQVVQSIRALGPLEKQLAKETAELGLLERAVQQSLQSLPQWEADADALVTLAVPTDATVQRYAAQWAAAEQAVSQQQKALVDAIQECDQREWELASIAASGEVASEESLIEARSNRDQLWRQVRRALTQTEADAPEQTTAPVDREQLAEALETAQQRADRLADLLRTETARIERYRRAQTEQQKAHQKRQERQAAVQECQRQKREQEQAWVELWKPLGLTALPPEEMREWLRRRLSIVEQVRQLQNKELQRQSVEQSIADACQRLSKALEKAGQPPLAEGDRLVEQLDRAQRCIEQARVQREARGRLEGMIVESRLKLKEAQLKLERKEQEREAWRAEWEKSVSVLGQNASAQPSEMEALLQVIEEIRTELVGWKESRHRIKRMQEDASEFESSVKAFVSEVCPELSALSPMEATAQLIASLQEARQKQERRKTLLEQIEQQSAQAERAKAELDRSQEVLQRLCQQAGCSDPSELERIENEARRKREAMDRLRQIEDDMLSGGGGLSLEQLLQEAQSVDGDALSGQLDRIEIDVKELDISKVSLVEQRLKLRQESDKMSGADEAARMTQEAEAEMAKLREASESWIKLTLAGALLRRGIERYRERNQGPLLRRAGELFGLLTSGSFAKLEVDYAKDDKAVLYGTRIDGKRVGVEGMSDGTRDQLYLALRLAVVEQYLARNEALPLVADDLLINFDDGRCQSMLGVLGMLASKTQVLYFTHHEHVLTLARQALGPERLVIHNLPQPAVPPPGSSLGRGAATDARQGVLALSSD